MTGNLFDISDFATQDGPGIRTVLFFKGCPLNCQWCSNPESQSIYFEPMHHTEHCIKCGNCIKSCRLQAIRLEDEIRIDHSKCAICSTQSCATACSQSAIQIVGRKYSVEQVIDRILSNRLYYQNSCGGITFSGGEALFQLDFAVALAERIKDEGLGLGLETCGYFDVARLSKREAFLKLFDFVYFDIKLMDEATHLHYTGRSLQPILNNLELLVQTIGSEKIQLSLPIIPLVNDNAQFIEAVCELAQSLGISKIRLLPYHAFGKNKYKSLNREYLLSNAETPSSIQMNDLASIIRNNRLACDIIGIDD